MALDQRESEELDRRLEELPSLIGSVPHEVDNLVHGLLATEENQRFALNYLRDIAG